MNERNLNYIRPYNLSRAKEIVDNKILTKKVLEKDNIPTPPMLAEIRNYEELKKFNWDTLPSSFVMKPVHGLEGSGIEIFYNRDKQGNWIKSDGARVSVDDLNRHAIDILDGKFALHNQKDHIFFEERVKIHPVFKNYAYKGAPDIRVIVFNNIPVMSYVRLPTKESDGKANLAKGAMAAAIDLATGTTTTAILGKTQLIETVPGTKLSLSGLKIPYWDKILKVAVQAQKATGLGYAAVDFLLDRERGPLIIELNARPGLSIQITHRDGLGWRLRKVVGLNITTVSKGVRIAKDLFGGQMEEEIEKISGKQIIGHIEPVEVITLTKEKIPTLALIDSSRRTTTMYEKLAKRAGIIDKELEFDDITVSDVTFNLGGEIITSDCRIVKKPVGGYNLLIGRKDLGNFLLDISKIPTGKEAERKEDLLTAQPFTDQNVIDNELDDISKQISIISNIRPINLDPEKKKFKNDTDYNPRFEYNPISIDTDRVYNRLLLLHPDTSSKVGQLFADKIEEMKKEILLLEAIREDNKFPLRSRNLYGMPDDKIFAEALNIIKTITPPQLDKNEKILKQAEIEEILRERLKGIGFEGKIEFTHEGPNKASVEKSGDLIRINADYKFTNKKLIGTMAHEIDVHLYRAIKGAGKQLKIFSYGTAGYIEIEEGLAVWNKAKVLGSQQPVRNAAIMYVSAYMNNFSSFNKTYKYLCGLGISPRNAFSYALRSKRGISNTETAGAFLKDLLYFSGYLKVNSMTGEERQKLLDNGKTHVIINELTDWRINQ